MEIVDFLAHDRKPGLLRFGADLLPSADGPGQDLPATSTASSIISRTDGEYHPLTQGYTGLGRYPTFFAADASKAQLLDYAAEQLHSYLLTRKHQVQSDRSLGPRLDEQGCITAVLYLTDAPTENPALDALGDAIGTQPTWTRGTKNKPSSKPRLQRKKRNKRKATIGRPGLHCHPYKCR